MKLATAGPSQTLEHPLDMLEQAVEENGWPFERSGRDEQAAEHHNVESIHGQSM